MTRISSAIAAALLASASFASAALAANEGDYYEGASADQTIAATSQGANVDRYGYTGSVTNAHRAADHSDPLNSGKVVNRGDYYDGAFRPN